MRIQENGRCSECLGKANYLVGLSKEKPESEVLVCHGCLGEALRRLDEYVAAMKYLDESCKPRDPKPANAWKWVRKYGVWHCLNPYGEDTVISKSIEGEWAVSHGGEMVSRVTRHGYVKIRTFRTFASAKRFAERLVRKFRREIIGPDNQCFECGSRIVRGKCAYCERERKGK